MVYIVVACENAMVLGNGVGRKCVTGDACMDG